MASHPPGGGGGHRGGRPGGTQRKRKSVRDDAGSMSESSRPPPGAAPWQRQLAKFIKQHIKTKKGVVGMTYTSDQITALMDRVKGVLSSQDCLVKVHAPVKVVGDIHGQYTDLKRLLRAYGKPPEVKYIFLGDYVDRGRYSLECVMLLFAYKALYPDSIILLRGNHETESVNRTYGFYDELHRRGLEDMYKEINAAFNWLPLAALVDKKILCMHGGISQFLTSLEQIRTLPRPTALEQPFCPDFAIDLIWADPHPTLRGYAPSDRDISFTFGLDALERFCHQLNVDLIVRAHQVVDMGFERMGLDENRTRLVTIFSAPNYCNTMDNSAAVMTISESLSIHFSVLQPIAQDDLQYFAERNEDRKRTPKQDVFPHKESKKVSKSPSTRHQQPLQNKLTNCLPPHLRDPQKKK